MENFCALGEYVVVLVKYDSVSLLKPHTSFTIYYYAEQLWE